MRCVLDGQEGASKTPVNGFDSHTAHHILSRTRNHIPAPLTRKRDGLRSRGLTVS